MEERGRIEEGGVPCSYPTAGSEKGPGEGTALNPGINELGGALSSQELWLSCHLAPG